MGPEAIANILDEIRLEVVANINNKKKQQQQNSKKSKKNKKEINLVQRQNEQSMKGTGASRDKEEHDLQTTGLTSLEI